MPRDSTPPSPPANVEAEQGLLGALLLVNEAFDHLPAGFDAEMFYEPVHGRIFGLIAKRISEGHEVSPVTLKTPLKGDEGLAELGGTEYLARLAAATISVAAVRDYAETIRDLWARRSAMQALQAAEERLGSLDPDSDPTAAVEAAQAALSSITAAISPRPLFTDFSAALEAAARRTQAAYENDGRPLVSTGLAKLDAFTGGFIQADHWVFMGESSMGKTALALAVAWDVMRQGKAVFIGSLEMPSEQMAHRLVSTGLASRGHRIEYNRLITGNVTETEFRRFLEVSAEVQSAPIVFAEDDAASLPKLMAAVNAAKRKFERTDTPLGLVLIDYLQMVRVPGTKSRTEEVSAAALGMKGMAKALGVPVASLSQMNQDNKTRENKRPSKGDARQSGEIEHSADVMIGCYRAAYYVERELQAATDSEDIYKLSGQLDRCRNIMELIALKNRRGPLETTYAWCDLAVNALADEAPTNTTQEEFI